MVLAGETPPGQILLVRTTSIQSRLRHFSLGRTSYGQCSLGTNFWAVFSGHILRDIFFGGYFSPYLDSFGRVFAATGLSGAPIRLSYFSFRLGKIHYTKPQDGFVFFFLSLECCRAGQCWLSETAEGGIFLVETEYSP